jgi:hypothetical protein
MLQYRTAVGFLKYNHVPVDTESLPLHYNKNIIQTAVMLNL